MTSKRTRFLSLLLCCVMLLSLMPMSALADGTGAAASAEDVEVSPMQGGGGNRW